MVNNLEVLIAAKESLEHTIKVFSSMADRGHYPEELLRGTDHFLGKHGFQYASDVIRQIESVISKEQGSVKKTSGMVDRYCDWCGNKFSARRADVKRGWGKTCSKSCAASLREKKTGNYQRYLQHRESTDY